MSGDKGNELMSLPDNDLVSRLRQRALYDEVLPSPPPINLANLGVEAARNDRADDDGVLSVASGCTSLTSAGTDDDNDDSMPIDSVLILCQNALDVEHIRLSASSEEDPTGTKWRHRTIDIDEVRRARRKNRTSASASASAARTAEQRMRHVENLTPPANLRSPSPDVVSSTWYTYRSEFAHALRTVLKHHGDWMEILRSVTHRMAGENGQPRIHALFQRALSDTVLHRFALRHCDLLLYKIDVSFSGNGEYGADASEVEWKRTKSRRVGEDVINLAERVLSAYVAKKANSKATPETVCQSSNDSREVAERYRECLRNDAANPGRGERLQEVFWVAYGRAKAAVDAGEKSAAKALNIIGIARSEVSPVESGSSFETSARKVAGAVLPPPVTNPAPSSQFGGPPPSFGAAPPLPPQTIGAVPTPAGKSSMLRAEGRPKDRDLRKKLEKAEKANDLAVIGAIETITGMAKPSAGQPPPATTFNTAPPPPPGSAYTPSKRIQACPLPAQAPPRVAPDVTEWNLEIWKCCVVDFDRLDQGIGTDVDIAVARARPSDKSMTKAVANRPTSGADSKWGPGSCAYCANRPPAPPNTPDDQLWWFGEGPGNHNPYRCPAKKCYLANGGDTKNDPAGSAVFLASCLTYRPVKRNLRS
jgi:hypothetical protein